MKQTLIEEWGKPKMDKHFRLHLIQKYFLGAKDSQVQFHIISDKVCNDLDFDEVFRFVDRTVSKIGQQFLYYKLRCISSKEHLYDFDKKVESFSNNPEFRIRVQLLFAALGKNDAYHLQALIHNRHLNKPKRYMLVKLLVAAAFALPVLAIFKPVLILLLIPVFTINLILHYSNKSNIEQYLDGVSQLNKCLKIGHKLSAMPEIKSMYHDFDFLRKLDRIRFRSRFISFDKSLGDEFSILFLFVIEVFKSFFNIEYVIFYSFIDQIVKEKDSIDQLFRLIGELDTAISTASLKASDMMLCKPEFIDDKCIKACDIIHPLIADCTPNSFTLDSKSMLLTGSNMSGKTTFIRTVSINSILAQTLSLCFAKSFAAPYFRLYSSIRLTDNLMEQTSYYLEEVLSIKALIDAADKEEHCLFVLDEIFKGTNTIERISGGKAILAYLNKGKHMVFVSTHDVELTVLLEQDDYALYHFSETVEDEKLHFDHKLKPGKLTTRNAIKILDLYNYPKEIIEDALKTERNFFQ